MRGNEIVAVPLQRQSGGTFSIPMRGNESTIGYRVASGEEAGFRSP